MPAKTANEKLQDSMLQHQVHLIDYATGLSGRSVLEVKETDDDLDKIVLFYVTKIRKARSDARIKELYKNLARELKELRAPAWNAAYSVVSKETRELVKDEILFAIDNFNKQIPVVLDLLIPDHKITASEALRTPIEGATLKQWYRAARDQEPSNIIKAIKKGLRNLDLDNEQVAINARRIADRTTNIGDTLVLTSVNNTTHLSTKSVYRKNPWMVTHEVFTATLDGATTVLCAGHDGEKFKIGEGPEPPIHFRCRSRRLPFVSNDNLGSRPFDPSTERTLVKEFAENNGLSARDRDALPRGYKKVFDKWARNRRRELIGKEPIKMTYDKWFRRQSVDFQNERLGIARATAYRKGKFHISRFTSKSGNMLTLRELRAGGMKIVQSS